MLLRDMIAAERGAETVCFEYGYYGREDTFFRDEKLSVSGTRDEVLAFIDRTIELHYLYACSGECNDFTVTREGSCLSLRFIDFR